MPNNFIVPSVVAREALMILTNELTIAGLVYRDADQNWSGAKKGDTIALRRPATFTAQEFTSSIVLQNITEGSVNLVLEKHFDVSVPLTAKEKTLRLEDFSAQVVRPAMVGLAEGIDAYVYSKYTEIPNFAGAAGTPPGTLAAVAALDQKANELKIPSRGRVAVVNPASKAALMGIEAFHRADARGDQGTALREASMGRVMGFDWYMAQNVKSHTKGTATSITVTTTASAGAAAVALTTTGTLTLKQGDLITFANHTTQYVVTGDVAAVAGAMASVGIYPALTAGVPSTTVVTLTNSHIANLAFHPNAIALATVPLELPYGAAQAGYFSEGGMGIRVVYGYDMSAKQDAISFDILVGAKVIQPELGFRILG